MTIAVYRIINTRTGDCYIGGTVNFERRKRYEHFSKLRSGKHESRLLQEAWDDEIDKSVFVMEVVEECSRKDLRRLERAYVAKLQPAYNRNSTDTYKQERREWYADNMNEEERQEIGERQRLHALKHHAKMDEKTKSEIYSKVSTSLKSYIQSLSPEERAARSASNSAAQLARPAEERSAAARRGWEKRRASSTGRSSRPCARRPTSPARSN